MNEWYKLQRHGKEFDLIVLSTLSSSVSVLRAFIIFNKFYIIIIYSNTNVKYAQISKICCCVRLEAP